MSSGSFLIRADLYSFDEFEAFAVNGENIEPVVFFQIFTKFCNINIHASGIEITIIAPDDLQGGTPIQGLIFILAQKLEQVGFLGGKFHFLAVGSQHLVIEIKDEVTDMEGIVFIFIFRGRSPKDSVNPQ